MIKRILLCFFLLGILLLLSFSPVLGQTSVTECNEQKLDTNQCIQYLQSKLTEKQGQKKTLANQIAVIDNQVRLTELRIQATRAEISNLTLDIDTANKKIDVLEGALDNIIKVLINRVVATYQVGKTPSFEILLSSGNVSSFFTRLNYLKIAQAHDKELIIQTQQAKSDYTNQKEIFESKKRRVEALEVSLEKFTAQLAQERQNKLVLLDVTRNDELRYQRLLAQAQAELAVSFGGGVTTFVRDVSEGDDIGTIIIGQSGCSTGTHLHFEIHKNNSIVNPDDYLSPKSVTYYPNESSAGSISPHGTYRWPLDDPIYITQGYGETPYADSGAYSGNPHFGIDMYNNSHSVKAIKGGKLYRGVLQSCSYGPLLYAKIQHDDGLETLYLHMIVN